MLENGYKMRDVTKRGIKINNKIIMCKILFVLFDFTTNILKTEENHVDVTKFYSLSKNATDRERNIDKKRIKINKYKRKKKKRKGR